MEHYLDLRIVKTRQELYQALFENLKDQSHNLEKIKVLDICQKADVSAITFYKHFKNSSQLIKEAIKDQIENRLPIPSKLKPHNLKQLIIYLLDFFSNYFTNNKEIILNCVIYCSLKGYKNTYLDILLKLVIYYVKKELTSIFKDTDNISINIWSEFIVGGLFYLFAVRTVNKKTIDNNVIFNNIKLMNYYLK